eukprot:CAMPEP_0197855872 /NCGR_PEP_ID=MMETSP1438-20131217/27410_1 /TAXON_ID=1461541 /ORGANISM="Pterosperma sp., Strain CCMP1384" /LENGTH=62 /DNA_ID=CAMNT_0043471121 /DNA_START=48 /DNA_END=233 /DNA_ORIENTATION=+
MAYSPEGKAGFLSEILDGAMESSMEVLSSRVDSLVADCAELLQRRADLEHTAAGLGDMVRKL